MIRFTAKSRVALALVAPLVSVMVGAYFLGIVPDARQAVVAGRTRLCETVAANATLFVNRSEFRRLETALQFVLDRNDDLLSAGVRRADGELLVEVGSHTTLWSQRDAADVGQHTETSTDTHAHVPIWSGDQRWGTVKLCFERTTSSGMAGLWQNPWTQLVIFVSAASYLLFFFTLGRVLKHLDPSRAIPDRVREALDTLAEGLLVLDKDANVMLANQALAATIGRSAESLVGQSVQRLPWAEDTLTRYGDPETPYPWQLAMQDGMPAMGDMMQLLDDQGKPRTFVVNASPVMAHHGVACGVLVSFEDVTLLEETRHELRESKDAAEAANQAKSDFLARMSHEIRTPMNAVLGFTDVLRRGMALNDQERQDYLNTIHTSGQHLLELINDILDLSKIEADKLDVEQHRCSVHEIISEVVRIMDVRAKEKQLSLIYTVEGKLPATILSDALRVRQILTNLVGNAIKFTATGEVRIVTRLDCATSHPVLTLHVEDTGIGMTAEAQASIFQPFSQADTSITRRFGGTGLGLTISRRLAEALGGKLTVASRKGQGSVFSLVLPIGSLTGVPLLSPNELTSAPTECTAPNEQASSLHGVRVLLADDGESNRKLLELVLRRAGASVAAAENGQQAVDLSQHEAFDIVLMDMQMPIMDGFTATRTLRDNGLTMPIVALTADAMQGVEEECLAAGCTRYLAKPVDIDSLLATMVQLAGHVAVEPQAGDQVPRAGHDSAARVGHDSAARVGHDKAARVGHDKAARVGHDGLPLAVDHRAASVPPVTDVSYSPAKADDAPASGDLVSSLPADDVEFCEVIVEFTERLAERLEVMEQAYRQGDLTTLAQQAHWLKGSGGTAGFAAFTEPARRLEQLAKDAAVDQLADALQKVQRLASRIRLPNVALPT